MPQLTLSQVEQYLRIDELISERVNELCKLYKPQFRSYEPQLVETVHVHVVGYSADYEDEHFSIPTSWLTAANWKELIDAKQQEDEALERKTAEAKVMSNWSEPGKGDWIPGWILVGFLTGFGIVLLIWELWSAAHQCQQ